MQNCSIKEKYCFLEKQKHERRPKERRKKRCAISMKPQTRSSRPEVSSGKDFLKICSKFTGEHPCRSVISIKFQSNFIEITLRHGCSPINVLYIFRAHFLENTYGGLLLPNEFSFESRGSVCIYFF